jgi:outer membrane protein assembly factor BamA
LGNDRSDVQGNLFYETRQIEFLVHPTIGYQLGPLTDVTLGPVVKYSVTDSTPNRFIADAQPLGLGRFGQAGLQMDFRHDTRDDPGFPTRGFTTQLTGSYYPATWSVKSPFEKVSAAATAYFSIPVLTRPVLALRAGAEKLFGNFPYYEAAFLGGSNTVRTYHFHQYAGDAAYYGSTELRVPVAQFPLFLPWNIGLIGFADAGRVYVDNDSPGGWHTAAGIGGWIAVARPGTGVSILVTNRQERRYTFGIGFHF